MLSEELRQLREERRMGPTQLARLSGVSRTRLYALEGGQGKVPHVRTLLKIAKGLSAWRTGEPDASEYADLFRRLEIAAGYPVDQGPGTDLTELISRVPADLAGRLERIVANYAFLNKSQKSHVVDILGLASSFGPHESTPLHASANQSESETTKCYVKTDRYAFERYSRTALAYAGA